MRRSFGESDAVQLGRGGQRGGVEAHARAPRPKATSCRCTARSTGARSARCRRRRSPSGRHSRRWCPTSRAVEATAEAIAGTVDADTAAVLLGRPGRVRPPAGARGAGRRAQACDRVGAALVFDEVQCGVGQDRLAVGLRAGRRGARRDDLRQGPRRRDADRRAHDQPEPRRLVRSGDHARPSPAARSPPPPPARCSTSSTTRSSSRACTGRASGSPRGSRRLPGVGEVRARGLMVATADIAADAPEITAAPCSSSAW